MDALLRPYVQATDPAEADRLLAQIVSAHAEPNIRTILRRKLRVYLDPVGRSPQSQDAEDIYSTARVQLVDWLYKLKANPQDHCVSNFQNYVAVITYNAYNECLRRKYPRRHRLRNKLCYLLDHQPGFARWESANKEPLCGFAVWRDRNQAPAGAGRVASWRASPPEDVHHLSEADSLAAFFRSVGGPIELDDLVHTMADLWGIKDEPEPVETNEEEIKSRPMVDPREPIDIELTRRYYLQRLWAEISQLLPRQRAALLLNLRDPQGNGVIELFTLIGITLHQIAEALNLAVEQFAGLWNDLPLDDAAIARQLGITRQQVINLRKSARERLARRMKGTEGSS